MNFDSRGLNDSKLQYAKNINSSITDVYMKLEMRLSLEKMLGIRFIVSHIDLFVWVRLFVFLVSE